MTWPERADRWLKDHPALDLIKDGLAIVALGWLFYVFMKGLML